MTTALTPTLPAGPAEAAPKVASHLARTLSSVPVIIALAMMGVLVVFAIFAPWLATADPVAINPDRRLQGPSWSHLLGTDAYGRDLYSRIVWGARVSLVVGFGAALTCTFVGLVVGVITGYFRTADAIIMRVLDGLMAIPGILLAIALVSLTGASLWTVLVAIAVPETPRVVRLVRSIIFSIRSEPYVEAAIALGTRLPTLLVRHMVPNTVAPLIVQGTFVFASAMLTEAAMSFLGVGLPPEIPSWGNIMAEGRMYFQLKPGLVLSAGIVLSLAVLSINMIGDAMRDGLDPRMARKL